MEAFFLSSLASFVLTLGLLAGSVTWSEDRQSANFGIEKYFTISIDRKIWSAIAVLFILLCGSVLGWIVLGRLYSRTSFAYSWHDFLVGPVFVGMVMGFLFGVLFAFWIRELIALKPGEPKTSRLIFQAIILAILLGLGAFSDILRSYASRVSHLSVAGAEFDFSPVSNGKASGGAQPGTTAISLFQTSKSSGPVAMLATLGSRVKSDRNYIEAVIAKPEYPTFDVTNEDLDSQFYKATVGAYSECILALRQDGADDVFIDQRIRELLPSLRGLARSPSDAIDLPEEFVINTLAAFSRLLVEVDYSLLRQAKADGTAKDGCKSIVEFYCAAPMPAIDPGFSRRCTRRPNLQDETRRGFLSILHDRTFSAGPYLALAYAGALWRLQDFSSAASEIDAWLRRSKDPSIHPWYRVRARLQLASILEEWVRTSINPPTSLLRYHLDNLNRIIDGDAIDADEVREARRIEGLASLLGNGIDDFGKIKEKYDGNKFERPPLWDESNCSFNPQKGNLVLSLISEYELYIYRAVRMQDYEEKYSEIANKYRDILLGANLGCVSRVPLPLGTDRQELQNNLYLAVLQGFVDTERAYALRLAALPDAEAARRVLEQARIAAHLGLRLAQQSADNDRRAAEEANTFDEVIASHQSFDFEKEFSQAIATMTEDLKDL